MTRVSIGAFCVFLMACSTSDEQSPMDLMSGAIEVRPVGGVVNGSSFTCVGTWPSSWTPCGFDWPATPFTMATDLSANVVSLSLTRVPIPVDGGASMVTINLDVTAMDHVVAGAEEDTTRAGDVRVIESSMPTSGWIQPSVVGHAADRNAGSFSLTFAWGTISGTYDTNSP